MYIIQAAKIAEAAKLEYRQLSKAAQKDKEAIAVSVGRPLSAKDKERERSRRESAVTRKRAEVFIEKLQSIGRFVPGMEREIIRLRRENGRFRSLVGLLLDGGVEEGGVEGEDGP